MKLLGCIALLLSLTACSIPYKQTPTKATKAIEDMVFVRHSNGACFGVNVFLTYYGYTGVSITWVPDNFCEGKK